MEYATACRYYDQGKYKEAVALFTRLVLEHPLRMDFWQGLAAARQMQGKCEAALHAWSIVIVLTEGDPIAHFHAAECLFALHDFEEGMKTLLLAEETLEASNPLHEKIQELKHYYGSLNFTC